MTTHIVTVKGLEARVNIYTGNSTGYPTSGITFDEDALTVTETDTTTYGGYCHAEIVYKVADQMLTSRRQIESEDVRSAVEESGLHCTCDIDDEEI